METTNETGASGALGATDATETTTQQEHNQLFDKCFKFLMQRLSSKPLIKSINGLFGKRYPLDSVVSRMDKEFITSSMGKILTDSLIMVDSKPYLIEVQIQNNSEMVIRMVEYGLATSRFFKADIDGILTAYFPYEIVIYLESNAKTPDEERMCLVFPDRSKHLFTVPTLKLSELTLKQLKAKGLFILMPFRGLNLRKAVAAAKTSERKAELALELKRINDELLVFFEQEHRAGTLTMTDWNELVVVLDKLNEILYKGEPEFKEVLNMFDDLDNDPRIIAAKEIDAAIAKAEAQLKAQAEAQLKVQEAQLKVQVEAQVKTQVEAQVKTQVEAQVKAHVAQATAQMEARVQASERQRQALELRLQAYERRDFR